MVLQTDIAGSFSLFQLQEVYKSWTIKELDFAPDC